MNKKLESYINYVVDDIMSKTTFLKEGRNKKTPGFVTFPFAYGVSPYWELEVTQSNIRSFFSEYPWFLEDYLMNSYGVHKDEIPLFIEKIIERVNQTLKID
jgi:hypothetical protein